MEDIENQKKIASLEAQVTVYKELAAESQRKFDEKETKLKEEYRLLLAEKEDQLQRKFDEKETKLKNEYRQVLADKEEQLHKEMLSKIELEMKVKSYEKVLRIIGVRSKLEDFVGRVYPKGTHQKTGEIMYGKPNKLSCCDAISEIINSSDPQFVENYYVKTVRARLTERNIDSQDFMKFIHWLYNQFSDKTCHRMAAFAPVLPSYEDKKAIKEMLEAVDYDKDLAAIACIQVILQPF